MANFFNPNNPQFRRGVFITSIYSVTLVGTHLLFADFGTQEHVFSPVQRYFVPKIDKIFGVTEEEVRCGLQVPVNQKKIPQQTAILQQQSEVERNSNIGKGKGWLW